MPRRLRWVLAIVLLIASLALPAAAQATLAFVRHPIKPTVFVAADNGSNPKRIALGTNPLVSPRGEEVAYLRPGGGRLELPELMLARVDGAIPPRLLAGEMQSSDAFTWSPDSTKIAAVKVDEDGREYLVLIDIVANTQSIIASGYFSGSGFSPDGMQLIYAKAQTEKYPPRSDVYRFEIPIGQPIRFVPPIRLTHDHRSIAPLWGPDGKIVFAKQLGAKQRRYGPKNELYLMDEGGGGVRRLTHTEVDPLLVGLFPTAWSASGNQLLAEFEGQDTSYAVAVNPRTGKQRMLAKGRERGLVGAAISSGGNAVLGYTGGFEPGPGHDVVKVPYGGGRKTVLARNAFEPSWSR